MAKEMEGKVALVTGAASGIGRAVALAFAQRGCRVVVSDVDQEGGSGTVDQIKSAGGEARFIQADVSKPDEVEALVGETVEGYGQLDCACNNAGIGGATAPAAEHELEDWHRVIDINLSGVFYSMKYEIPAMLDSGGGAIVNMASILGQVGFGQAPAYVAAKHGVLGLTKTTAIDYAQRGIRVNAVLPGFIHTPLISELEEDKETRQMLIGLHPVGRLGKPEEVAGLVVWLCSDEASFVTGSPYLVDGGYVAR